jgi:hypothetical protein
MEWPVVPGGPARIAKGRDRQPHTASGTRPDRSASMCWCLDRCAFAAQTQVVCWWLHTCAVAQTEAHPTHARSHVLACGGAVGAVPVPLGLTEKSGILLSTKSCVCVQTWAAGTRLWSAKVVARVHRRCDSFQHTTGAVAAANSESAASQLHTPARTSAASLGTAPAAASGSRGPSPPGPPPWPSRRSGAALCSGCERRQQKASGGSSSSSSSGSTSRDSISRVRTNNGCRSQGQEVP